ncbi:MAG: c-type cytochrome, partial [Gammaproteobacteria bacterium]|nr:c-type cytochrome [Gammaproteobacteria bacterium]
MNTRLFRCCMLLFCGFIYSSFIQAKSPGKEAQCFACHGVDGVSVNPAFPSLAGQNKAYIIRQLQAFKSGDRKN